VGGGGRGKERESRTGRLSKAAEICCRSKGKFKSHDPLNQNSRFLFGNVLLLEGVSFPALNCLWQVLIQSCNKTL
jgi:hypothetical protein